MINKYKKRGFVLIELIITITLMGIIMVPLGIMSMEFMRGIVYSRDSGVVDGLAKVEMAKINNLVFGDTTLADGYDNTATNYEGYPYDLRRIVNFANPPANTLKKVQVRIYPSGNIITPLLNTITYRADVSYGAGSGSGSAGSIAANFLEMTGGNIYNSGSAHQLINVTMQNISPSLSITITAAEVSFTGASGIKLQKITINAVDGTRSRWSGSRSSPAGPLSLSPTTTLAAGTSYSNPVLLDFNNKRLDTVESLVFTMSDGSTTTDYSWP